MRSKCMITYCFISSIQCGTFFALLLMVPVAADVSSGQETPADRTSVPKQQSLRRNLSTTLRKTGDFSLKSMWIAQGTPYISKITIHIGHSTIPALILHVWTCTHTLWSEVLVHCGKPSLYLKSRWANYLLLQYARLTMRSPSFCSNRTLTSWERQVEL